MKIRVIGAAGGEVTGSAYLVETGQARLLVDTATDLRQQMLRHAIDRVDAVLFTHAHADHILGLDDLRHHRVAGRTVAVIDPS